MCNCFFLSTVITGTSYTNTSTAIIFGGRSDENSLSVGVVAGITLVATLLVVLPVGVVLGCCGLWCLLRCHNNKKKKSFTTVRGACKAKWVFPDREPGIRTCYTPTEEQLIAACNRAGIESQ